eukprot:TRINITY_DN8306_c0_g1_i1.p1 TRINITY_DN8306_c0_g1~~TRINITY_DN8306_c0_g1_i1.p1  ORF type:complete len:415 (+),score=95.74 TRINITY_DN8306_c0_g1_i1:29-1246(+)
MTARIDFLEAKLIQKQVEPHRIQMIKTLSISESSIQTLQRYLCHGVLFAKESSQIRRLKSRHQLKDCLMLHQRYMMLGIGDCTPPTIPTVKHMKLGQLFNEISIATSEKQDPIVDKRWVYCGYNPISRDMKTIGKEYSILAIPELFPQSVSNPFCVAIHHITNRIYVADTGHNRILIFNADHELHAVLTRPSAESLRFNHPRGISISPDGETIIVVECYGGAIHMFDANHILKRTIKKLSPAIIAGLNDIYQPNYAAFDSVGNFYVSDRSQDRILKFDRYGDLLLVIGGKDCTNACLRVNCILIDDNDDIIAFPQYGKKLHKYSSDGKILAKKDLHKVGNVDSLCRGPQNGLILFETGSGLLRYYDNEYNMTHVIAIPKARSISFDQKQRMYVACGFPTNEIRIY